MIALCCWVVEVQRFEGAWGESESLMCQQQEIDATGYEEQQPTQPQSSTIEQAIRGCGWEVHWRCGTRVEVLDTINCPSSIHRANLSNQSVY